MQVFWTETLNVTDSLANLVQSFIPIIEDSETTSVPCGGAVRSERFDQYPVRERALPEVMWAIIMADGF